VLSHRVLQATELEWCTVYRWDHQANTLQLVHEAGSAFWPPYEGPVQSLRELPTLHDMLQRGEARAFIVDDLKSLTERAHYKFIGVAECLVCPVKLKGDVVAVVEMMAGAAQTFDDSAFSLVQGIANIIGSALQSANLYSSLEHRAQALESAYHEVEEINRLKDDLLQNISHELGTPLTHILGYLSLLSDQAFGPLEPDQQSTVDMVIGKTQLVADLLKHMIALHGNNRYSLNLKPTDLGQLAALAVRSMTPKAQAAGLRIVARIAPGLPQVEVDPTAMGEVFEALLDNAIKFSFEGKFIQVSVQDTPGPALQVCVSDEGIGIPEGEFNKIFRQFYQIDGGTTRQYGGMGLGLAIVQKVVQAHGGRVWIESELGKGTSVYFIIPTRAQQPSDDPNRGALAV
jgi:signal transduction histidine kinase